MILKIKFSSCVFSYQFLLKVFFPFLLSCPFPYFVYGAEPKRKIKNIRRQLYLASKEGNLTVAHHYGYHVDIHSAVKEGNIKLIQELEKENPDIINVRDEYGNSPLHWAAKDSLIEMVQWLLDKGADPNAQNLWGQTPLLFVSWDGKAEVAQKLLDKGADPSIRDENGFAPWDFTFWPDHVKTAKKLLKYDPKENSKGAYIQIHGIKPKKETRDRKKILYLAARDGRPTVAYHYGYNVNILSAVKEGNIKLVQELEQENPDLLNVKDEYGNGLLHWAVKNNFVEIVQWFLDKGADPNAKNLWGQPPLFFASWSGEAEIALKLLDKGADPSLKDKNGLAPWNFTFWLSNEKVIQKLLEYKKALGMRQSSSILPFRGDLKPASSGKRHKGKKDTCLLSFKKV